MKLEFELDGEEYEADIAKAISISIPLYFDGPQPDVHGIESAKASTMEIPGIIGDTHKGGSCNWQRYSLIPHSHGTHTECVGHITDERVYISDCLPLGPI